MTITLEKDPNSYADPTKVETKHLHLDLNVDFEEKVFICTAKLLLHVKETTDSISLDTRDLAIDGVHIANLDAPALVNWPSGGKLTEQFWNSNIGPLFFYTSTGEAAVNSSASSAGKECKWELGANHHAFGSPLEINTPSPLQKNSVALLTIQYKTSPSCSACQWLDPIQTAGKKFPYLFTQCQAIHARSLVPCQDSPGLKFSYSASVKVEKPLTAVMSALDCGKDDSDPASTIYRFKQPVPIPSYLIALAVGKLTSRSIGPRSRVWSEEETVEAGAYEFADTETFVKTAEQVVSSYVWQSYDVLLLPPSFPYGGMENPCLTFVTPTLIAGDRSLVDVVAHEISHSWAGNLVTNLNWQHFWLNEGFCVYIERKILGALHGEKVRQFKSIIGWNALKHSIETFGAENPLTKLVVDLNGVDPDDAFSSVPYEKGFNLLYHLECAVGGPTVFDSYLKAHFEHFAYRANTTDDWKDFLYTYIRKNHPDKVEALDKVDWNSWLHKPGMPPVKMPFDTTLADQCTKLAVKCGSTSNFEDLSSFEPQDYKALTTDPRIVFLEELLEQREMSHKGLEHLWSRYEIQTSKNAEIRFRFFQVCLKAKYVEIFPEVVKFLKEQGRMKFIRPLYRSLMKFEEGRTVAKSTFEQQHKLYHPIAAQMVSKDLQQK